MNMWQKESEIFKEECANAFAISQENLCKLMEDNQNTAYGKKYGFAGIKDVKTYQNQVPISDYSDYEPYIVKMRQGDAEQITAYDVKHYIMSSGSTGVQKKIPLSKEALARCIHPIYYTSYAKIEEVEKGGYLHLSVFRMEPPQPEKETILSAAYFRELLDRGDYELEKRYLGGTRLLFQKGIGCVPYVKAWIALCNPQMAGIQAFFLYDVLLFLHWFEENWNSILSDIKNQKIPAEMPLSEEVRELLLSLPVPEEIWFDKVKEECEKGMEGIIKRLFHNMKFVSGVGGSTFFAQEQALRSYLGDIPLHYFSYAASECMMAITTEVESTANVLMPRSGFFEFLPYANGESNEEDVKCIWELEIGKNYEILITNFSGFYRYRLNDVVKVVDFYGEAPVLEVCFRKNQAVNVAGEKMDLQTVARAMEELGKQLGMQIYEYSICDDKSVLPGYYLCFYEAEEKGDGGQKDEAFSSCDSLMDEILKELHEDYKDVRQLGLLQKPKVFRVKKGTHSECKKEFGAKQAQNKPLQYLADPDVIAYMKERIV